MKIDCHTHTSRFSSCSVLSADKLLHTATQSKLDAVVITEHETFWPQEDIIWLREAYPQLSIFQGVETSVGSLQHVVVIPPEPDNRIIEIKSPQKLTAFLKESGSFAFAAHPFRWGYDFDLANTDYSLFALEVASSNMNDPEFVKKALDFAEKIGALPLAASDAHCPDPIGDFYIDIPGKAQNEQELINLLKNKNFTPVW